MVVDGIKGLDTVIGEKFPGTPLQRCVTHLKRNMFAKVRHGDKVALAADLSDIFRTEQRDYTVEMAWTSEVYRLESTCLGHTQLNTTPEDKDLLELIYYKVYKKGRR